VTGVNASVAPILAPAVAVLIFAYLGQLRRRLRDAGWRGGWTWLGLAPLLGLVLALVLLFARPAKAQRSEPAVLRRAGWALTFVVCCILGLRGWAYEPFVIPASSMSPALQVGDYVLALPVRQIARGDVVVFDHPVSGTPFVKRVIGLEGDVVQMQDGQIVLNSEPVPQRDAGAFTEPKMPRGPARIVPRCANDPVPMGGPCEKKQAIETLPSGRSYAVLDIDQFASDDTGAFDVPPGTFFALGDNRDNSLDSRVSQFAGGIGFVHVQHLRWRPAIVLFAQAGGLARAGLRSR